MNRRNFIKATVATTATGVFPLLSLNKNALAASPNFTDYKAIVILNLDGGNDAMNTFIPTNPIPYGTYAAHRGRLTIAQTNLYNDEAYQVDNGYFRGNTPNGSPNINQPYYAVSLDRSTANSPRTDREAAYRKGSYHTGSGLGINSMMPEMAGLYAKGKLSLISNVGTLVKPTTKIDISNGTAELPIFLFAHNHQSRAVETAQADVLGTTGWAGRLADAWDPINAPIGLNISYVNVNKTLIGAKTWPLAMSLGTPKSYANGRVEGEQIENLLFRFADNTTHSNPFVNYYNKINKITANLSTTLASAWENAPDFSGFSAKNSYGENLFTIPNPLLTLGLDSNFRLANALFEQLETTAKMIKLGVNDLSYSRQIFYVRAGNYDSHSNQMKQHSSNLRSLSLALSDFYKSLEEMGVDDKVLVISVSEFGRTLQNNGDGTDHGWGGHSFMLTGDTTFNGGQVLGRVITDLNLEGVNNYKSRGRTIPTTSIEQMLAPALRWFGVNDELMTTVLPNLNNFKTTLDDNLETAFLQNVFQTTTPNL